MLEIVFGALAFFFSATEEWIASRRTQALVAKDAVRTGNWSAIFDLVLFFDVIIIMEAGVWMVVPICAGSWLGAWYSIKKGSKP